MTNTEYRNLIIKFGLNICMACGLVFASLTASPAIFAATVANLNDSGEGSLRHVIENAPAGEVITFSVTGTVQLSQRIIIRKNLTITGPGRDMMTIRGGGSERILSIDTVCVSISGLTFSNGNSDAGGGGIYNFEGVLTLENCTVSGNTAIWGGGILNDGGSLVLKNCTVSDNTANDGGDTDSNASGGGLHNYDGSLEISDTLVSENSAESGGGIVNISDGIAATLKVDNCTISSNTADDGAGIFNITSNSGGSAVLEISDSTISGNSAAGIQEGLGYGGGVRNDAYEGAIATVRLFNCQVSENTAKSGGGVINNTFGTGSGANMEVSACTFDRNQAAGMSEILGKIEGGGAIFSMAKAGGSVTVTLTDTVFSGNSAAQVGGAVCHQAWGESGSSALTVTGCTFSGNIANTYNCSQAANPDECMHYYGGGAILNAAGKTGAKSDAVISDCKFLSNTAKGDGGGLFNGSRYGGTATLKMTDSTIDGNTSTGVWGGGGVFSGAEIDEGGQPTAELEMSGCTLSGNKVEMAEEGHVGGGGAVRIGGNFANVTGTLTNCTVSGNEAVMAGGGIVSGGGDSPASLTLTNCTVTDNTSEDGGGIYAFDPVKMKNTIVAKNIATMDSGNDLSEYEAGLYASDGNNLIGDSTGSTEFANDVSGDIVGSASSPADPGLGPLQDNGGSTATHALLEDSPAINTGSDTEAPDSDQRGLGREQTDIGAYEYAATEPGNIDGTGTTDLKDAILALKVTAGMPAGTISLNADVNRDRKIGLAEVIFILGKVSGLR
ncbi:choice-of-anchor Q domain-containing protein [Desulfonema magnum]|uniref:Probable pectate lyase C n=1 Tax=Desulfonema magnum TaxID=45655 RepID=A0A975BH04_9BACT|nr:choice-of-anchor Q domain-containing protein [Desulfonema magnum]QTA85221.1 Uncharacterized protein dnm_012260 [Desulfonema magnum]